MDSARTTAGHDDGRVRDRRRGAGHDPVRDHRVRPHRVHAERAPGGGAARGAGRGRVRGRRPGGRERGRVRRPAAGLSTANVVVEYLDQEAGAPTGDLRVRSGTCACASWTTRCRSRSRSSTRPSTRRSSHRRCRGKASACRRRGRRRPADRNDEPRWPRKLKVLLAGRSRTSCCSPWSRRWPAPLTSPARCSSISDGQTDAAVRPRATPRRAGAALRRRQPGGARGAGRLEPGQPAAADRGGPGGQMPKPCGSRCAAARAISWPSRSSPTNWSRRVERLRDEPSRGRAPRSARTSSWSSVPPVVSARRWLPATWRLRSRPTPGRRRCCWTSTSTLRRWRACSTCRRSAACRRRSRRSSSSTSTRCRATSQSTAAGCTCMGAPAKSLVSARDIDPARFATLMGILSANYRYIVVDASHRLDDLSVATIGMAQERGARRCSSPSCS